MSNTQYFMNKPAPHENTVVEGYEYLLSDGTKALLAENNLTVEIGHQEEPCRAMGDIQLAGFPALIPLRHDYLAITTGELKGDKVATIENIKTLILTRLEGNAYIKEGINESLAVYAYESDGRKYLTVYDDVADQHNAQFAGIAFTLTATNKEKMGSVKMAEIVEKELGRVANHANGDYMQFVMREQGRFIDLIETLTKDTARFDEQIARRITNLKKQRAGAAARESVI